MAMQFQLSQRLEQRLKMTAQMIQSIEMLQLPLMALEQQINTQLAENPVLEIVEEEREVPPGEAERSEREEQGDFERLEEMARDEEWEDAVSPTRSIPHETGEEDPKLSAMQNTAARPETLQEHVVEQVRLSDAPDRVREIAEVLAFDLDDNGYLLVSPEEVFAAPEGEEPEPPAPVSQEEAEEALALIQSLDPAGVGARTVEECLLLQLARLKEEEVENDFEFEERLIRDHFDDLLHNRLPKVGVDLGVDIERVKLGIARIGHLNPRPGRDFSPSKAQYVMPDVVVEERDGDYDVRMNDTTPQLRISPVYRELLKKEKRGSAAKEYLRDKMQSAKWLIDSIAQRRNTLFRISQEIVRAQKGFFEHGVSRLKPLQMQDVASDIGMHVSTVSRAIAGKYMDTPVGLYPMRYFFTGGYKSEGPGADEVSNRTVMDKIERMVGDEDKRKPLSDAEIAKRLAAEGLRIARRTVAKYREKLEIPASRQRKEY
jgi:RNA polymerase sigma-54 factor